MLKLTVFLLLFYSVCTKPIFAKNQKIEINSSVMHYSKKYLGSHHITRSKENTLAKLNIKYDTIKPSFGLTLNYIGDDNFNYDTSYLQYTLGIATFGVGSIDRNWSFSENTSLILSHNARPPKSIYLKLKDTFEYNWLPSEAKWSFEVFNGLTQGSLKYKKSMLLGLRTIISPIYGLDFELVQTSQWGGQDYDNGISALGAALFFDSNNGSHSNINKMAGFGISYLMPDSIIPLRIYGQAIGEDEAGSLPSCFAYLAGLEWSNERINYPTTLGIEAVDTRIDETTHGNCGPNTMYNNTSYGYVNYGNIMGAEIGSESTSLELFGQSQISQKMNIRYSSKFVTINDNSWSGHRLSSKRQSGLINSLGISLIKNKISFNGDIYKQSFSLDKASIKGGYGFGFSSSIKF